MLEGLEKIARIVWVTSGIWGPGLLIVILYTLPKIWPRSDVYFEKAFLTLQEVDDVTDAILAEYPNLEWINTVDDLINKVLDILKKRYNLKEDEIEKAEKRIKSKIKNKEKLKVANFREETLELLKKQNKTIVFASHSLSDIKEFCDKTIWLEDGKLKEFGPTKQVIHKYTHAE